MWTTWFHGLCLKTKKEKGSGEQCYVPLLPSHKTTKTSIVTFPTMIKCVSFKNILQQTAFIRFITDRSESEAG